MQGFHKFLSFSRFSVKLCISAVRWWQRRSWLCEPAIFISARSSRLFFFLFLHQQDIGLLLCCNLSSFCNEERRDGNCIQQISFFYIDDSFNLYKQTSRLPQLLQWIGHFFTSLSLICFIHYCSFVVFHERLELDQVSVAGLYLYCFFLSSSIIIQEIPEIVCKSSSCPIQFPWISFLSPISLKLPEEFWHSFDFIDLKVKHNVIISIGR